MKIVLTSGVIAALLATSPAYAQTHARPHRHTVTRHARPAPADAASDRRFPNGERVSLSFEPAGMMGGTGTITHRAPGQSTKTVTIEYMSEFGAIIAPNKVQYAVMGTTDRGQEEWSCEAMIDWRTAKIIARRNPSRSAHQPCGD